MNPAQVIDHFDRLCDAPDAIPRLRQFILELAVRGKLVEQDATEEPVSAQLMVSDRVRKETAKEDRRADSDTQPLLAAEDRWHVPSTWEWRGLADLVLFIDYRGQTPKKIHYGVRLITAKNVRKGFINLTPEEFISEADYLTWMTRGIPKLGDVLFTTEAPIGNAAVVRVSERLALAQRVINFRPYGGINSEFLTLQLLADAFQTILNHTATGLTAKGIKAAKLKRLPIAVPPLAEQNRIVAKVDELMALCDRLESAQRERESRRDKLAAASLHRLNNGANADEFREHARFHLHHLPRLTTRPEHIQQLRQTILNLAVRGKLVPQDPNDEPVSELLERLVSLGSEGGKVPKPLRTLDVDALPSELPFAWVWVQAQDLCRPSSLITYGVLKPIWVDVGVPTVRVQDMQDGTILVEGVGQCSPERAAKFGKTTLEPGDLLIAKDGATLGKTAFVPPSLAGGNITQHVLRFPLTPHVASLFIRLVIDSPHGQAWMRSETKGVALPGVNVGDFRRMPIPLPPLAEQHRIVAKVDELMALVDALETELTTARTTTDKLMEAVVAELTRSGAIYASIRDNFPGLSADQPNVLYRAEGPGAA